MKRILTMIASVWAGAALGAVVLNGQFDPGEWNDDTLQHGIYSDFRYQKQGSDTYIMNDWWNTDPGFGLQAGQWNTFLFTDTSLNDWEFRVYPSASVDVWKNGVPELGSGIQGVYGFGPSPSQPANHTLYEVLIPVQFDRIREKDPRRIIDIGDGGWEDGPFNVPEPSQCLLSIVVLAGVGAYWLGHGKALFRRHSA